MSFLKARIREIKNNRSHGSSLLLQEIINVFTSAKHSDSEIMRSFSELGEIDPSMVLVHHFLKELKPAIGQDFRYHVEQYKHKWDNVNLAISSNLQEYLIDKKLTVLTHSYSGVIIDVLMNLALRGILIDVIQTVSEPVGEGREQAKSIAQLGINTRVIKDEDLINSIGQVNCCFLGVDQYDDKSIVNKVGSRAIIEMAAQLNKPVFVLGDTRKLVDSTSAGTTGLFEIVPIKSHVHLINEKTIKDSSTT